MGAQNAEMAALTADRGKQKFLGPGQDGFALKVTHPEGLARWRKALGRALFQQVRVQCQGDSITAGAYANDTAGATNADKALWAQRGWVGQLRRLLATTYGDAGEGWVGFGNDEGRWTYTGDTVQGSSAGPVGLGGRLNVGGKASIGASVGPYTEVEILGYYSTNISPPTVFIDGTDQTPTLLSTPQHTLVAGATGWTNRGNTTLSSAVEGDENVLVATAAGAANMSFQTATGTSGQPVTPGQAVFVGAELKSAAASRAWRVGVIFSDAAGAQISELTTVDGTSSVVGGWQAKSNFVIAPAGSTYATGIVRIDAAGSAGEEHRVRRVRLVPSTYKTGQGSAYMHYCTKTGLADTTHNLELRGPGGGTGSVLSGGVTFRRGSAGICVSRVAKSGSTTKNHVGADQSAATQENQLLVNFDLMKPHLVVLALGANDFGDQASLTPDQFKTHLKTLTDRVAAVGGCTLLVAGPRYATEGATYTQAQYYSKMRELAASETHVAFIDVGVGQWKDNATANAVGFMDNALVGVHPLMAGHGDYARAIREAITSRALGSVA